MTGMPGMLNPAAALLGVPSVMNAGGLPFVGMSDQNSKIMRELFIGNTPPGTTEHILSEFLSTAMQQTKLALRPGNPISSVRGGDAAPLLLPLLLPLLGRDCCHDRAPGDVLLLALLLLLLL